MCVHDKALYKSTFTFTFTQATAVDTYDKISDDHREQKEWYADVVDGDQTAPHGLDPLSTQHSKHDHERVQKIVEVPTRQWVGAVQVDVSRSEQLFAHHGKDKDDDGEHKAEVAERAHRPPNDADQQVQRRPRLG